MGGCCGVQGHLDDVLLPLPVTNTRITRASNGSFTFRAVCMQGYRSYMEDHHGGWLNENLAVAGVFDGHSGYQAAQHIEKALPAILASLSKPMTRLSIVRAIMRLDDEIRCDAGSTLCVVIAQKISPALESDVSSPAMINVSVFSESATTTNSLNSPTDDAMKNLLSDRSRKRMMADGADDFDKNGGGGTARRSGEDNVATSDTTETDMYDENSQARLKKTDNNSSLAVEAKYSDDDETAAGGYSPLASGSESDSKNKRRLFNSSSAANANASRNVLGGIAEVGSSSSGKSDVETSSISTKAAVVGGSSPALSDVASKSGSTSKYAVTAVMPDIPIFDQDDAGSIELCAISPAGTASVANAVVVSTTSVSSASATAAAAGAKSATTTTTATASATTTAAASTKPTMVPVRAMNFDPFPAPAPVIPQRAVATDEAGTVQVFVVNVGDSRSIVVHRDGTWSPLSNDHKTNNHSESQRAKNAGALVVEDRIVLRPENGGLNLSRSMGDHRFKTAMALPAHHQAISPMPDVTRHVLREDDTIIIGSDGLYDQMGSSGVAFYVSSTRRRQREMNKARISMGSRASLDDVDDDGSGLSSDLEGKDDVSTLSQLVTQAISGRDNVTAVMLKLRGTKGTVNKCQFLPKPCPKTVPAIVRRAHLQNLEAHGATAADGEKETPLDYPSPVTIGMPQPVSRTMQPNFGVTVLHSAAYDGNVALVKELLAQKPDEKTLNARDDWGDTPLHMAVMGTSAEIVQALLVANADVGAANYLGWTPLCEAQQSGQAGLAYILTKGGASSCSHPHRAPLRVEHHSTDIITPAKTIPWLEHSCPRYPPQK